MTIFEAYIGGLHNFFSIWFFCLFQVTPFFLAYIIGLTMIEIGDRKWVEALSDIITGGILCLIGFMAGYIINYLKSIWRCISLVNGSLLYRTISYS